MSLRILFTVLCLCFSGLKLEAQQAVVFPQSTAVGATAQPVTVTITVSASGTLGAVKVLTQGSSGYDFSNSGGGTCTPGLSYQAGQQCTVGVGFGPVAPGVRLGAVVLVSQTGAAMGTQLVSGTAAGGLGVFVPGTINTVAGDSAWIFAGDGGAGVGSAIYLPFGFAVDAAGDLFIADSGNNRVRRVDGKTGTISTVAGNGLVGSAGNGGLATAAQLSGPTSVAMDAAGNLYVADSGNNCVRRVDALTGLITVMAGTLGVSGHAGDGAAATKALLNTPQGIAFDASGNLYIADAGNNAVRMVAAATGAITTVAGTGVAGFSGDGGPATGAQLNGPWSVTPVAGGGFYIADQNNQRVRLVDANGNITTVMGTGMQGYSGDGGPAAAAALSVPASVVVDVAGNWYVADSGNNRVRKVNGQTGVVTTIAGGDTESFSGDGGPANGAGLYGPYTLALDGQGDLLIADVFHNRIREIAANQAALKYPPMRVGRISTPMIQVMENDGNAPMTIANVTPVTNSQVDGASTSCVPGQGLVVFQQCAVGADFAPLTTGLGVSGTMNVNSDATNAPGVITLEGQVLDVDPATVAVTSSLNPATVGQTITFTVTANSAGTTPTGTVTLLDGTTAIAAGALQSGVANFQVATLAGGQHTITANYAGDTSNSAAVSQALLETVNDIQAPTVTTLASGVNPGTAGGPIALMATVSVAQQGTGNGAITGSVTFTEGATVLGAAGVSNGTATLTISTLGVGTHNVVATYSGDQHYAGSVSASLVERVQIATSKVVLGTSANPAVAGASMTLTAVLSSNGGVPTGSVMFLDGATVLGTATIGSATVNGQASATLVVPGAAWTVGPHTLTASYAGDAANTASVSAAVTEQVTMATTATALASSVGTIGLGGQISFTATVTGNGGRASGSVEFYDGTNALGSTTVNSSGVATYATAGLALGTHTLTAVYQGDAYDAGSTSAAVTETVVQATIAVTLTGGANPANFGTGLTLTANVTGTGSVPVGTVTFNDTTASGTVALGSAAVGANGMAAITATGLAIGPHTIVAVYGGDVNHQAATSAALAERVVQTTSTLLGMSAATSVAGVPVSFTATVTGANGLPVTGNVSFMDGATTLGTMPASAAGTATVSAALAPGQHMIVASYAGDALDGASTSTASAEVVAMAQTSVALSSSLNPAFAGEGVVLTAKVTGNGGIPTGTVTFYDGGTAISTAVVTNGSAGLRVMTLSPGIHLLTASYGGDPNDAPATSPALSEQIEEKTSVSLAASENPALLQDSVTITVTVSNGLPNAAPTGAVTLTDNGTQVGSAVVNAAGVATFALGNPVAGTHTLVASYAGDSANQAATSPALVETVTLRPTTTSFVASSQALSAGQQLIFTAIVAGQGTRAATGTVTFASGATVLGQSPISASGVATLTVTPGQGMYNVTATYSGDSLFAVSTSTAIGVTVGPPTEFLLTTQSALTVQSGQHVAMTIAIASAPTFTDMVALGCAGLPASATCTFSTTQVALSGGAGKTVTVTVDTGNPLGVGGSAKVEGMGTRTGVLACVLPGGLLLTLLLGRRRLGTRGTGLLAMLGMVALLGGLSGCASSFNQNDTPAGSYSFQIVGTGQQTGATGAATVQLTVTQ